MGSHQCEESGTHSKNNILQRGRRMSRKAKLRRQSHQMMTRSNTASTGCTPPGTLSPREAFISIKKKSSGAWENIVLHYLSKLKKVRRPTTIENEMVHPVTPAKRESSATKFRRERHNEHRRLHYNKYISPPSPTVSTVPSDFCLAGKRKAFNIVSNAIEYGLANGIVSKNGNFFWLRHKVRKHNRKRRKKSLCSLCRMSKDGLTLASTSYTAEDIEKDDDSGHALAVNKSRPKVTNKPKPSLPTKNLKVRQAGSSKASNARSVRSVSQKSRKSRTGIITAKSIPKDSVALARSKSRKSVKKVPSALRNEYVSRIIRAKTKDRDCRCPRCLKKYTLL